MPWSARRAVAGVCLAVLVALGVLAPTTSSAATLGGLRSVSVHTQGYSWAGTYDSFDYPVGTNLSQATDRCGNRWNVVGGTFTVTDTGTTVSSTGGLVTATVPVCPTPTRNVELSVDMLSVGSSLFGVLLQADASGRPAMMVTYTNSGSGTVQLWSVAADGARTEVAAAKQTGGGNMNRTLRASYIDGTYTVYLNEVRVLTYVLPAQYRPTVEARTYVGIAAVGDMRSTFDNFQAWPR